MRNFKDEAEQILNVVFLAGIQSPDKRHAFIEAALIAAWNARGKADDEAGNVIGERLDSAEQYAKGNVAYEVIDAIRFLQIDAKEGD